ncbi:3',5'-cyclic-AMP phosphodiesterase [Litoribrevibacter albus]|uniref:3',5'-cyclic adenosine monophosphate phosphodiesterase CpdA n=1 Tax=Litoribrevibacter albus TaxID=1473156 RepID=A0AA37SE13_9GAMM|nr:3',5'-cyclic-AMP phosphodiesterase [Litoribrevibacter albus]GLQ32492.1 3',5'-cyclic adenosine monophosphate phosphodiesterase CpdA [Litoribrevibacter albus]
MVADRVRIVQITDSHLFKSTEGDLLGMKTEHSLGCVTSLVQEKTPDFDLVLATGDISQDGSIESYRRMRQRLEAFGVPFYWLSGNHDQHDVITEASDGTNALQKIIDLPAWRIVMLDSSVSQKVHGYLKQQELDLLTSALETDKHILVCFHHHPINVGARWIDNIGVKNASEFMDVIDGHPQVKGVLWGHVHQEVDEFVDGKRLLATPSTCIQFTKYSDEFAVDTLSPGYRYLELLPDGSIETEVHRVTGVEFTIDYSIKGY